MADDGEGARPQLATGFAWDGETVEGRLGEPVAVALWRAGHVVQTRSIKYHRPRGPQCFAGGCAGCLVRVDGVPNQLGCRTPVRPGLEVESQVGRPSAARDLFGVVDRIFGHLDHERAFVRPAPVSRVYEAVARHMAGFGEAPTDERAVQPGRTLRVDVLVAGAGPAGLGAALEAGRAGASVLLVGDAGPGGSLLHTPGMVDGGDLGEHSGPQLARVLVEALGDDVERVAGGVFGLYEDGVGVLAGGADGAAVHHVHARTVVLATGAHEGPVLVPGNDAPGVLGARAARVLLNRWGVAPGERVAVLDPGREGRRFADEARAAGLGVEVLDGAARIEARTRVEAVVVDGTRHPCDAVVVDGGLTPAPELAQQAQVPFTYQAALGGRVPLHRHDGATPIPDVHVAGSCAGLHEPAAALLQGRLAGARAAGSKRDATAEELLSLASASAGERAALQAVWAVGP